LRIKRSIFALICTSTLIFAGCSAADSDGSSGNKAAESGDNSGPPETPETPEPDVSDVPEIVATVNDTEITRDLFLLDYESQFEQAVLMNQGTEPDQGELKRNVVDMLINRELLIQTSDADGIKATDEKVDEVLRDAASQSGLESIADLLAVGAEQGFDEETMRRDAELQYVLNTYIEKNFEVPDTPEYELRAQYDEVVEMLKQQGNSEEEIPDFDDVRDQLNDEAKNMEMTAAVDELLAQLREDAEVTVLL